MPLPLRTVGCHSSDIASTGNGLKITGVNPSSIAGSTQKQSIIINGSGFQTLATVILNDGIHPDYPAIIPSSISSTQLVMVPYWGPMLVVGQRR